MYDIEQMMKPNPIPEYRQMRDNLFRVRSVKMNREVMLESQWEYFHWILVETNPEITQFCEQQIVLQDPLVPDRKQYTFDMWMRHQDGHEECVEVKPVEYLITAENGQLVPKEWKLYNHMISQLNQHCYVVTDEDLQKKMKYIINWQRLLPFVRHAVQVNNTMACDKIRKLFRPKEVKTLYEIQISLPSINPHYITENTIYLLYQGLLTAPDINRSYISPQMKIARGEI